MHNKSNHARLCPRILDRGGAPDVQQNVGIHQYKNRVTSLGLAKSPRVRKFLTIPYKSIVFGILVAYGVTYKIMKLLEKSYDKDGSSSEVSTKASTKTLIIGGAMLGLSLSLIGRFGLNLPVKMFNMPPSRTFMVHAIANVLYAFIFMYVERALSIDF